MRRVTEKVKDIVEVFPFKHLHDFAADPALTLAGYHFTDITADLMAQWIGRVASVKPGHGTAVALAGFRGVGKSHFLAATAAILAKSELRPKVSDPHVAASTERLSRRHYPVAFVRRGSSRSLFDELKYEIAKIVGVQPSELSDSIYDVLLKGSDKAGDLPLVLLFDTAVGRETRVSRDDGVLLSEIAEAAKTLGIFIGAALDDDIAGADGPNSAISGCFTIDYLDQEHLYKIVDAHIFSKHNQMIGVLHEIYDYYREVLPGFRWSEQRFSSLYPLHPATLEIAPLIRLYIQDFALLGFASEAGVKILGRPANSLIGLDEVFDSVENRLRNITDLREAFVTFDELERNVISKEPVQTRLRAKLILKGLMMLSLDGQGSTADEIAASMLIYDENGSSTGSLKVEGLLASFVASLPTAVSTIRNENSGTKYCLKIVSKENVHTLLQKAISDVPDEAIWNILLQLTADKFSDVGDFVGGESHQTNCNVEWRGAIRRGKVVWNRAQSCETPNGILDQFDWTIWVRGNGGVDSSGSGDSVCNSIEWKLAALTEEEKNTLRQSRLLHTDAEIRETYGDGLSTALQLNTIAVEKIWQRVFLLDSVLVADGMEFRFSESAQTAHTLSHLLSLSLSELFCKQYPSHPVFSEVLGSRQESGLIANFLSGAGSNNADAQRLAAIYASPLGLAFKNETGFSPVTSDSLLDLPTVKALGAGAEDGAVISLDEVARKLLNTPEGLTREAGHLVLASLVAARQLEFVTSSGNRINHRSLDLQIVWDDIVGIAKPLNELYSPERLLTWAKLITGNSSIRSLDRSEDRLLTIDSVSEWLAGWKENRILADFDALPDESLNAAIWRTAANLRKSFGAMAEIINGLVKNEVSLDQCIHSIAELFSDSETEFEKKKSDLHILRDFTAGVLRRDEIARYLSLCETTYDQEIESNKQTLLNTIATNFTETSPQKNNELESLWTDFVSSYSTYYAGKHDVLMKSASVGDSLREIIRSTEWSAFECLSTIPWLNGQYGTKARVLIRELRQLYCSANAGASLATRPYCSCTFSLSEFDRQLELPNELGNLVKEGLMSFHTQIFEYREALVNSVESDAMRASITVILDKVATDSNFHGLTSQDFRLLKIAAGNVLETNPIGQNNNIQVEFDLTEDKTNGSLYWQNEIAQVEAFVNVEL